MPSIHIENIGPIERADFHIDEPGIYIIEGGPGVGKTTSIETINFVVNGQKSQRVTRSDGANRGLATVAGKTIRISKTTRSEGELKVEGLGDFSIAGLHAPKFDKPETRDHHRIQALAVVAGVKLDRESFYPLLGGKADFSDIVPSRVFESSDPVDVVKGVKSAIEQECRRIEKLEAAATEAAKAQADLAEGIDLTQSDDEKSLQDAWQRAISRHGSVKEKREAWLRTQAAAKAARQRLEELPPGKSVKNASESVAEAEQTETEARQIVSDLEKELSALQVRLQLANVEHARKLDDVDHAREALRQAQSEITLRGELDAAIEAASGAVETTEDDVDDAAEDVGTAKRAAAQGMKVREAKTAKAKAAEYLKRAEEHREKAQQLRAAAQATFDVLSDSIAKIDDCPLRVKSSEDGDPRLVVKTDRSDHEYFSDLSDGEQLDVIIRIAVRKNRLIPLSQGEFGELSGGLRAKLHEIAKKHGAYIVTAVATDGELRGVKFDDFYSRATNAA